MADRFRWAVFGTGNIARQFCGDLAALPGHAVAAVGSRSHDAASAFASEFGGTPHGSYDALLDAGDFDAVYLSLPNSMHAEWAIKSLRAGHATLCEKPLATSRAEAERMFAAADEAGRPLVEAFMYRCHPQTRAVIEAVRRGDVGEVRLIRAGFCYRTAKTDGNVRFDPALAGGSLMDVGCYCLDAAALLAGGEPKRVVVETRRHDRGVDVAAAGTVAFDNGVFAGFACGMDTQADNALHVCGSEGYITVAVPWKPRGDAGYTLSRGTPPRQDLKAGQKAVAPPPAFVAAPADLPLYALEAAAFAGHVRGEAEAFMPRGDSLRLAGMLEAAKSA